MCTADLGTLSPCRPRSNTRSVDEGTCHPAHPSRLSIPSSDLPFREDKSVPQEEGVEEARDPRDLRVPQGDRRDRRDRDLQAPQGPRAPRALPDPWALPVPRVPQASPVQAEVQGPRGPRARWGPPGPPVPRALPAAWAPRAPLGSRGQASRVPLETPGLPVRPEPRVFPRPTGFSTPAPPPSIPLTERNKRSTPTSSRPTDLSCWKPR